MLFLIYIHNEAGFTCAASRSPLLVSGMFVPMEEVENEPFISLYLELASCCAAEQTSAFAFLHRRLRLRPAPPSWCWCRRDTARDAGLAVWLPSSISPLHCIASSKEPRLKEACACACVAQVCHGRLMQGLSLGVFCPDNLSLLLFDPAKLR